MVLGRRVLDTVGIAAAATIEKNVPSPEVGLLEKIPNGKGQVERNETAVHLNPGDWGNRQEPGDLVACEELLRSPPPRETHRQVPTSLVTKNLVWQSETWKAQK